VDEIGDDLLARPRFAGDQDGRRRFRRQQAIFALISRMGADWPMMMFPPLSWLT